VEFCDYKQTDGILRIERLGMEPAMSRATIFLLAVIFAALGTSNSTAAGPAVPAGYKILDITLSPDHRYGVTVPDIDTSNPQNSLVDVETGRVLAVIQADAGYESANHNAVLPARWAKDDSLLLWEVEGKWFDVALVLLKVQNGAVLWQLDLLKAGQQAILARTKQAKPKKYLKAKEENQGSGSAYPEGFTVDVVADGDKNEAPSLPMKIRAYLTSNPKGIETLTNLDSRLDAVVDKNGKLRVTNFHLGTKPPAPNW
jgi:hypothetical protein